MTADTVPGEMPKEIWAFPFGNWIKVPTDPRLKELLVVGGKYIRADLALRGDTARRELENALEFFNREIPRGMVTERGEGLARAVESYLRDTSYWR